MTVIPFCVVSSSGGGRRRRRWQHFLEHWNHPTCFHPSSSYVLLCIAAMERLRSAICDVRSLPLFYDVALSPLRVLLSGGVHDGLLISVGCSIPPVRIEFCPADAPPGIWIPPFTMRGCLVPFSHNYFLADTTSYYSPSHLMITQFWRIQWMWCRSFGLGHDELLSCPAAADAQAQRSCWVTSSLWLVLRSLHFLPETTCWTFSGVYQEMLRTEVTFCSWSTKLNHGVARRLGCDGLYFPLQCCGFSAFARCMSDRPLWRPSDGLNPRLLRHFDSLWTKTFLIHWWNLLALAWIAGPFNKTQPIQATEFSFKLPYSVLCRRCIGRLLLLPHDTGQCHYTRPNVRDHWKVARSSLSLPGSAALLTVSA